MTHLVLPLLVAIVGLLLYVLATRAEVKEIGRLMFGAGLLVALFTLGAWKGVLR